MLELYIMTEFETFWYVTRPSRCKNRTFKQKARFEENEIKVRGSIFDCISFRLDDEQVVIWIDGFHDRLIHSGNEEDPTKWILFHFFLQIIKRNTSNEDGVTKTGAEIL